MGVSCGSRGAGARGQGGHAPPPSLLKLVIKRWPPPAAPYIWCFLPPPPPDHAGSDAGRAQMYWMLLNIGTNMKVHRWYSLTVSRSCSLCNIYTCWYYCVLPENSSISTTKRKSCYQYMSDWLFYVFRDLYWDRMKTCLQKSTMYYIMIMALTPSTSTVIFSRRLLLGYSSGSCL